MKRSNIKILFACAMSRNPFLQNLKDALSFQQNSNLEVHTGSKLFWELDGKYDIVHLHWIEALAYWNLTRTTAEQICERLKQKKMAGTKVCITFHNIQPHTQKTESEDLYRPVLEQVDGVIHMGQASQAEFEKRYMNFDWCNRVRQTIISHPSYAATPNYLSKEECRKVLSIDNNAKVVLAFGAIRSSQEADFCVRVLDKIDRKNLLFVCPRWRIDVGAGWRRKWIRKPQKAKSRLFNQFISEEEVQLYLNSCDVVLLPRVAKSNLNSGVPPLAFTFGRVVVGPNQGVIGELLTANSNFCFEPGNVDDAVAALQSALDSDTTEIEKGNLRCSQTKMSAATVGSQHLKFYEKLLES